MSNYIMNMETQKLELHFDKFDYMALSDDLKKEIKSNFLFIRKFGAWVSRAKFPNLFRAEAAAKKLGLKNGGRIGDTLTFAEQMERKAERAEARAERYDYKSDKAQDRGEALQKPINDIMEIFLSLLSQISIVVLDVFLQTSAIECLRHMIKALKSLRNQNIMRNAQQSHGRQQKIQN